MSTREKPILMSAPMVRALLVDEKTQARRIVKMPANAGARVTVDPGGTIFGPGPYLKVERTDGVADVHPRIYCPYGYPGDRLWVREGFTHVTGNGIRTHYRADGEPTDRDGCILPTEPGLRRWTSPLFMPRKESRITLEIVGVRVERLHAITAADAWAEGIDACDGLLDDAAICRAAKVLGCCHEDGRATYGALWAEIHGEASLVENPWVWIVDFRRVVAQPRDCKDCGEPIVSSTENESPAER